MLPQTRRVPRQSGVSKTSWLDFRSPWVRIGCGTTACVLLLVPMLIWAGMGVNSYDPYRSDGKISVRELIAASIQLTNAAGQQILDIHRSQNLGKTSKGSLQNSVDDPLTEADMTSHRTLVSHFRGIWPEVTVVSEETDESKLPRPWMDINLHSLDTDLPEGIVNAEDVRVWVDPLDATLEFTQSIDPEAEAKEHLTRYVTVLACVVVRGDPVAGVIHFPFDGTTLWGWTESGTNFDVAKDTGSKDPLKLIISRSHAGDFEATARSKGIAVGSVTPAGGAGYKVAEVLRGNQDAYLHKTLIKKWDLCAGDAVLRSAGGQLTDWSGQPLNYANGNDPYVLRGVAASLHRKDDVMSAVSRFDVSEIEAYNRQKVKK